MLIRLVSLSHNYKDTNLRLYFLLNLFSLLYIKEFLKYIYQIVPNKYGNISVTWVISMHKRA